MWSADAMRTGAFVQETPGVSGGYPCVGNTRIRVSLVVESYHAHQRDIDRTADFFDLTPDQVRAALEYYEQHRDRVDEDIRRNRRDAKES
jgi:uncharacterized protein (DUF433 family)